MASNRYESLELGLKVLTLVGAVTAAAWAIFTYTDTKQKEFYTTYWNKKLELFLETSRAASQMATTTSPEDFNAARETYWELFFGRLSLVEGDEVKRAMEEFSAQVPALPLASSDRLPMISLQQPAYRLTVALKRELGRAWREPFSELPAH